jgi:hypothetical protein
LATFNNSSTTPGSTPDKHEPDYQNGNCWKTFKVKTQDFQKASLNDIHGLCKGKRDRESGIEDPVQLLLTGPMIADGSSKVF